MENSNSIRVWLFAFFAFLAVCPRGAAFAASKFIEHPDIVYYNGPGYNDEKHRLDVYVPEGAASTDVVMFTHGGAWVIGDRKQYAYVGRAFAARGLVTVVISYRLSPEVKHPGHITDVAAAFAWTYRNIEKYGGNPKRIFIAGQSAGGHLTALLATNDKYLKANGLDTSAIRGAIPISGVYDFSVNSLTEEEMHDKIKSAARGIFTEDAGTRVDASPLSHVRKGLPPMLIIVAKDDPGSIRRQTAQFKKSLEDAGEKPEYLYLANEGHVSEIIKIGKRGDPITDPVVNFIKSH